MLAIVARRLASSALIALGVTVVCFTLLHMAPGDVASALLPDDASPQMIAQIRAAYGLDKPLPVQYALWLGHVLHGDFGRSLTTGRDVSSEVVVAISGSLELAIGAMLIAVVFGVSMGALAAAYVGRPADKAVSSLGIAGMSIPPYWLAMVLIVIFAVLLRALPATGAGDASDPLLVRLSHLVLPTVALAAAPTGIIARSVRSSVADVLQQDFIDALRARGLRRQRIIVHVLKNAAPASLAVIGLQFGHLLGGSILVETIFAWPGAGFLLNSAIFMHDIPIVEGVVLGLAMMFVFTNLCVDLLQMAANPRLRRAG
jgi:peptide/nickel transport system permease protein